MDFKDLSLNGKIILLDKVAKRFEYYVQSGQEVCPEKQIYCFASRDEDPQVTIKPRIAALQALSKKSLNKTAFDTRRVNQEFEIIPRRNLQFWHRSQEFIEDDDQEKLNIFAKLHKTCQDIKFEHKTRPEWHDSYARILADAVERILRIKQGDSDIDRSQLAYLEQLMDTRYKLSMNEIDKLSHNNLKERILSKDESLQKRGVIYDDQSDRFDKMESKLMNLLSKATTKNGNEGGSGSVVNVYQAEPKQGISKDQNEILASLFGTPTRKDGERTVERTVTITIRDNVVDKE